MKSLGVINPDDVNSADIANFQIRQAARAIVFDTENNVALLHVSKHGYYKLPGGGIEEGEDNIEALKRECLEEIGTNIEVTAEIGKIIEYRKKFSQLQTSYCYKAKIIGEKGIPIFTDSEQNEGFEFPIWIPLGEAIRIVSSSKPDDYQGSFIKERDTLFLQTLANTIKV